jgi:hypothetical protein
VQWRSHDAVCFTAKRGFDRLLDRGSCECSCDVIVEVRRAAVRRESRKIIQPDEAIGADHCHRGVRFLV